MDSEFFKTVLSLGPNALLAVAVTALWRQNIAMGKSYEVLAGKYETAMIDMTKAITAITEIIRSHRD